MAGLTTPLHLAASLLALVAAAGLAVIVLARPGVVEGADDQRGATRLAWTSRLLLAAGALAYATGHGLSGALVGAGDAIAGLRAGGLVLIALGLSPRQLAPLTGAAVVVPTGPVEVTTAAAIAGAVGAVRAIAGGRRTALVGIALLAWGAAEAAAQVSLGTAGALTLLGAAVLGAWLWQASRRQLQAKFVVAFVTSLLAVVVLMAGVLSTLGANDLVAAELRRLGAAADNLTDTVDDRWPQEAKTVAGVVGLGSATLLQLDPANREEATQILGLFGDQDFYVLIGPDGRAGLYAAVDPALESASFRFAVAGAPFVDDLFAGVAEESGEVVSVGGQLVALGGVRINQPDARAEDPPAGVLVTGRVVDQVWVEQSAAALDTGVIVESGGQVSVASAGVAAVAGPIADALGAASTRGVLTSGDTTLYVAASDVVNPQSGLPVGRVMTVSQAEAIAALERDQARRLFLLALVGALFAGAVAAVVTGRLVAPIRRLTQAAAAVREGELGAQTDVGGADEVGDLGRTFNEMTASLATQSTQLRESLSVQARLRGRLEALTASMSDALIAVDPDGRVLTFNPAAERLTGRAVPDVLDRPLGEVLRGRSTGAEDAVAALGAADSEDVVAVQLLVERPDGRPVPTAVTAAPVHDSAGAVLGRVLVLRDISREAEIERMKSEFLSNVSHELRTPLTPIKGYAEVLARRDVGPDATRQFAGQILASTSRLERIVGMIVDFAGLDSGRTQLLHEHVVLGDLVGDVIAEWRQRHPEREFRRRVASSLPRVCVDGTMLRRCLDELLDNAVKFSPDGGPISISAQLEEDVLLRGAHRSAVRLSVRDRGVGIEPETALRIFSDFYQADASETRHYGGLGLGLALVRRIVDGLGGEVAVHSEPAKGSTFQLVLPAAADHPVCGTGPPLHPHPGDATALPVAGPADAGPANGNGHGARNGAAGARRPAAGHPRAAGARHPG